MIRGAGSNISRGVDPRDLPEIRRGQPRFFLDKAGKLRLAGKSAFFGDLLDAQRGLLQQFPAQHQPFFQQEFMQRHSGVLPEDPPEMVVGDMVFCGDVPEVKQFPRIVGDL